MIVWLVCGLTHCSGVAMFLGISNAGGHQVNAKMVGCGGTMLCQGMSLGQEFELSFSLANFLKGN